MNLKKLALFFFFVIFTLPMALSYADENLEDIIAHCNSVDALEALLEADGSNIDNSFEGYCEKKRQEASGQCAQKTEKQKAKIDEIIHELNDMNPVFMMWSLEKLNVTEDPSILLMNFYAKQYDVLNDMLDELTEGVCSGLNVDFLTIKDQLAVDYGQCRSLVVGNEGVLLSCFHSALSGTAMIIKFTLDGAPLSKLYANAEIILGLEIEEAATEKDKKLELPQLQTEENTINEQVSETSQMEAYPNALFTAKGCETQSISIGGLVTANEQEQEQEQI